MAWLANQAAIDLHPWTSRLPRPIATRPTRSSTSTRARTRPWSEVLALARLYRAALGHLGVRGLSQGDRQARHPGLGPDRAALHVRPDTRDGSRGISRAVGATRARPRELGVGEGVARRPGAPRLHPERGQQDARRALRGAAGASRRRSRRRSPGTSSTIRTCAPDRWDIRSILDRAARARRPVRRCARIRAGIAALGLIGAV